MAIGGFELLTKGLEMEKAKAQRLDGSADPISQALAKISKDDSDDAKYRLSAIADQMAAENIDDLSRLLAEQAALLNFVFAQSVVDAFVAQQRIKRSCSAWRYGLRMPAGKRLLPCTT